MEKVVPVSELKLLYYYFSRIQSIMSMGFVSLAIVLIPSNNELAFLRGSCVEYSIGLW